ncbi:hypothetical protein SG34_025585 [Thalassomonas viridans]|uniref:Uncharacterized protein n=1 Tax=Thalassomonas viridans TaxID=137584 RepID=A0AAF0C6W8_9GAMM|nr:hypothetical protein [Thalassomonas viridans]WDE04662.1 hypothetical protein SG34_025585 [Thalassomonas viridans]
MKAPYFDKVANAVFFRGALHLINPDTNEPWENEQEALAFIAALPVEAEPLTPGIKITSVTGTGVDYSDGIIYTDAGELLTVDVEIQHQGVAIEGFNRVFRVPIDRDGQQGVKVLKLEVHDGVGRFVTKFDSGEFFINEQTINRRLAADEFIAMDKPLHIVVAEAPEVAEVPVEAVASEETPVSVQSSAPEQVAISAEESEATATTEMSAESSSEIIEVKTEVVASETAPAPKEAVAPVETSAQFEAETSEEAVITTESIATSDPEIAPATAETASPQ